VRVDKYLDGAELEFGVPVQFRPVVILLEDRADRRTDLSREAVTGIAPVGSHSERTATIWLEAGAYDVEAVLPSGELLSDEVEILPDRESPIVLRGESSPNEWRSWSHFAGGVGSASRKRLEQTGQDLETVPDLEVTIGSVAHAQGAVEGFNPSRWDNWFEFSQSRSRHRDQPQRTNISLSGNDTGLGISSGGWLRGAAFAHQPFTTGSYAFSRPVSWPRPSLRRGQ
jgi:hypothetical protein